MKVIVCGDREWEDYEKIKSRLAQLPEDALVIEGGCRGADKLACFAALAVGLSVMEFPADWENYGSRAGPVRNQWMLNEHPDLVIAFHSDLAKSRGTANMVKIARQAGVPVEVVA